MKAQNAKAVKDLLAMDSAVNLRESLRGPKDDYKEGRGPVTPMTTTFDASKYFHFFFWFTF